MTDAPGSESYVILLSALVSGVATLLAAARGDKEGRHLAETTVPQNVQNAVGAGIIDREGYRAVVDGMSRVTAQLGTLVARMDRLIELSESAEEREVRERQRDDLRDSIRILAEDLRQDLRASIESRKSL